MKNQPVYFIFSLHLLFRVWEIFLILLVVYSAWICPFEFAFLRYLPGTLFLVDNIVNIFFATDIVLTFFVAFLDRKTYLLVDDHKRIAVRLVLELHLFSCCFNINNRYPTGPSKFHVNSACCKTLEATQASHNLNSTGIYHHGSSLMYAQQFHFNQSASSLINMAVDLLLSYSICSDSGASVGSVHCLRGPNLVLYLAIWVFSNNRCFL